MRTIHASLGVTLLAGMLIGGCGKTETAPPAETAATVAAPAVVPTAPPPAAKDLTHVLTKDEPFFASEPTAGATPTGTLKSGSKVLVLIPGAEYSQVITDTGISAYTVTDGLKPLGK